MAVHCIHVIFMATTRGIHFAIISVASRFHLSSNSEVAIRTAVLSWSEGALQNPVCAIGTNLT